jgi:hypothetical protein
VLPDELQHQQLVEIRIQQRPDDRIQFPVMIVSATRKINNHNSTLPISRKIGHGGSEMP